MLEFINLFLVPFISVNIFYKREKYEKKLDASFLVRYALCVVAVYFCTYLVMSVTRIAIGISGDQTSSFYSMVAIMVSFIVPYIYIILARFAKISFEANENRK